MLSARHARQRVFATPRHTLRYAISLSPPRATPPCHADATLLPALLLLICFRHAFRRSACLRRYAAADAAAIIDTLHGYRYYSA